MSRLLVLVYFLSACGVVQCPPPVSMHDTSTVYSKMCAYLTHDPVAKHCKDIALGRVASTFVYRDVLPKNAACLAVGYAALRVLCDDQGSLSREIWSEIAKVSDDVCGQLLIQAGAASELQGLSAEQCEQCIMEKLGAHEKASARFLATVELHKDIIGPLREHESRGGCGLPLLREIGFFEILTASHMVVSDVFCDSFMKVLQHWGLHPLRKCTDLWVLVVAEFFEMHVTPGNMHGVDLMHAHKSFNLTAYVEERVQPLYTQLCARLPKIDHVGTVSDFLSVDAQALGKVVDGNPAVGKKGRRVDHNGFLPGERQSLLMMAKRAFGGAREWSCWLAKFLKSYVEPFDRRALAPLRSFC